MRTSSTEYTREARGSNPTGSSTPSNTEEGQLHTSTPRNQKVIDPPTAIPACELPCLIDQLTMKDRSRR
ncbi:hypothetical protein GCM10010331_15620 [Streptomyces xanthochromogenes]|nr:hypothetical protein GCM10010331_15620 [Streptomyces xanthochromogenes]